ncbi:conserved Plasmodium protein, unknown function [Plasmodium vinckei brucechwatti]|uniref:Uncharacterized protein n=1 Tax=Plasmodium vinckei brucechwatti TaxID=119398 RepID=A0A6V7SPP7_PLAVN|nr:conserved Plasmodium protein, unknown function [Plasmodium vinckei brucechwatti]
MDRTHNYTSAFYILDFNSYKHYSTKFWSFIKYPPTEDIIIISFKNDFERKLFHSVKLSLKNEIEWMESYKFINLKSFENCPFIFLVKTYLYNEIHGVYFKNIKIATKKVYGKIYKTILKSYFYNFVKNKWKKINLLKNIQLDDMLEDSLGVFNEQEKKKKKKKKNYVNTFTHYEYGLKNKIMNISSNNNTYNYLLNKTFLINACVEENKHFSTTHEKGCDIKNLGNLLRTCSDFCYKKSRDNNYAYSCFKDKLYSKNANDLNDFSCIRFKIKNTSLCICVASINLFEHIDSLNYYKDLFSKYRNKGKNKNTKSNYTDYCLNYYAMCCKQLYNYFINKLIFETQKKDICLFNNDIIIFFGFETNILIEKKTDEIKNILNDYSIFPDKNFVILNKKNIIQPKAYSTLIIPDDGAKEFKLVGFRVICNLIINNIHNNDVIKKVDNHIKKGEIKNVISVSPDFINLNIIHTYQIYQTSFTLSYECNDTTSQNIFISNINHKNRDVIGIHIDDNYPITPQTRQVEKKNHLILNKQNEQNEYIMFTTDRGNNNENNFATKNSKFPISFEENLKKYIFEKWHTNISSIFNKKNNNYCRSNEIKKDRQKNKDINIVDNNNNKIGNKIPEKLYFSIFCFDETNNCTIPINLYSFLHIKQNSIFKYFEQNICFKNNINNKYNFNILRHVYMYPYKGILQPNSKKHDKAVDKADDKSDDKAVNKKERVKPISSKSSLQKHYEKKLHTSVDELEEEAFLFLKISHIDNYNIIYSFNKFTDKNFKEEIYNLNFMKKKCLFKEMFKGIREENNELGMHKINQLILKIEQNMKIDKNISINLILFLCEELLYIINKKGNIFSP